jgi:hypothetical protein
MRVSRAAKPSFNRYLEYVVDVVFHGFSLRISHYSGKIVAKKKAWTKSLSALEALRSPQLNDKSKAHAGWHEHFAY